MLDVIDTEYELVNYLKYSEPELINGLTEPPISITLDYSKLKSCDIIRNRLDTKESYNRFSGDVRCALRNLFNLDYLPDTHVWIKNYDNRVTPIPKLRHNMIGKLVSVDCLIRKVSTTRQEIVRSAFICKTCGKVSHVMDVDGQKLKPKQSYQCANSNGSGHKNFEAVPSTFEYRDMQYLTLQEPQEAVEGGKQPETILGIVTGDYTDTLMAGNRCRVLGYVGIKRASDEDKEVKLFIDIIGVARDVSDYQELIISADDERLIKSLSESNNVLDMLADSIVPSIYGYKEIKRAIALQLFGGTTITLPDGTHIRGNSHILLCGDPALAKSQIVRNVCKLCPRGIYTSGKSTSAAGLTAAAVKDEVDGKWVVEAGALVLADGGMACVDELDKIGENDIAALHEAMESQTISFAKAGINTTLYTRCSLLAACNPKESRFIPEMELSSQLSFPSSLLTRFDLVFLMQDIPNPEVDKRVARHMLMTRQTAEKLDAGLSADTTPIDRPIDMDIFRKYISMAHKVKPVLSDEVVIYLTKEYASIRNSQESGERRAITPRQLDALIRLSESSARIRLSNDVSLDDAKLAVNIWKSSMMSISLNGTLDISKLDCESNLTGTELEILRETKGGMIEKNKLGQCVCRSMSISPEVFTTNLKWLAQNKYIEFVRIDGIDYVKQYAQ